MENNELFKELGKDFEESAIQRTKKEQTKKDTTRPDMVTNTLLTVSMTYYKTNGASSGTSLTPLRVSTRAGPHSGKSPFEWKCGLSTRKIPDAA